MRGDDEVQLVSVELHCSLMLIAQWGEEEEADGHLAIFYRNWVLLIYDSGLSICKKLGGKIHELRIARSRNSWL